MTDKLTPEQRKRVAEEITRKPCGLITVGGYTHVHINNEMLWRPEDFETDQWKALVTWLSSRMYSMDQDARVFNDFVMLMQFLVAIHHNDTDALERMAYAILEAKDD